MKNKIMTMLAVSAGSLIVYAIGVPWLKTALGFSYGKALAVGMYPFVICDLLMIAAYAIAKSVRPLLHGQLGPKPAEFKHCNGLLTPFAGTVRVGGVPVTQDVLYARRTVGMVFQDADSQIVGETVYDDAAFGPENLNWPPAKIKENVERALQLVGLAEMHHRSPHLLSGWSVRWNHDCGSFQLPVGAYISPCARCQG